ncbi:hypothetical protein HDV62DRAFT_306762 [Trichoderma sp. SZMC 28011]
MDEHIPAFVPPHTKLGESPLYRPEDATLHYVDVLGQEIKILQLDSSFGIRTIRCPEPITFLSFHKDGGYLVCSFSSIVRVSEGGDWNVLKQVFSDTTALRLNDAGIDSAGRLWVGSIDRVGENLPKTSGLGIEHQGTASIYRYDPDGTFSVVQKGGVIAGNGLCWSPDDTQMYFVDSYLNCIWAYDFDAVTGTISNRRVLVERGQDKGEADGLLTDGEGNLYTFIWNGASVIKYNARGSMLRSWKINAARVTHGAWVGPKLTDMIVTSAVQQDEQQIWEGEEGGGLFYLRDCCSGGMKKHRFG